MQDIRCRQCAKLLARAVYTYLEIKCPRCRVINSLKAESLAPERPERLNPESCNGHTDHSLARRQAPPG